MSRWNGSGETSLLDQLDPEAVLNALATTGDTTPPPEKDKLQRAGNAAMDELLRRLEDPELAKELASTGLLNLCVAWQKAEEKRSAPKEDTGPQQDPIDLIMGTNLPGERKRLQLLSERSRTQARLERLDLILEGAGEAHEQFLQRAGSEPSDSVRDPERPA